MNETAKLLMRSEIDNGIGMIGISKDLRLGEGSDAAVEGGDLRCVVEETHCEPESYQHMSDGDKIAIGEIMIARWQRYIDCVHSEAGKGS